MEQNKHIGEIENVYPLTPMQKGMWFHHQMDPQSGAYFEQMAFSLQGNVDIDFFKQSFVEVVQRHAILRTNFSVGWKEEPLQIVYKGKPVDFTYEDLSEMAMNESQTYVDHFVKADKQKGFDLAQDALMRLSILRIDETTYRFIWSFHHILMDGWCLPIFMKELFQTYFSYLNQEQAEMDEVLSYSGYIEWLEQQDSATAASYWKEYLAGYEQQTLPMQIHSKEKSTEYKGQKMICSLGESLTQRITQIAQEHEVTVNILVQSIWGILLQKYTGSNDIVFGSVVSGRPAEISGIEQMIGLFINTIPVRICTEATQSFAEVIKQAQEQALESQAYDYFPLYEIQALTEQKQNLVNHIMAFENYPVGEQFEKTQETSSNIDNLKIVDIEMEEQTNYDLNIVVKPIDDIEISVEYNETVYEKSAMDRMRGHLLQLIEQIVANPRASINELKLVTEPERNQLLNQFNDTITEYPREKTIHQLFEEQVDATPNAIALVYENEEMTYRELNEHANRLARTLREKGIQADQLVGIMSERSFDMIVGILAILKAGGAYVPLDPEYPTERIRYIIEDSGVQMVLVQEHLQEQIPDQASIILLDEKSSYHEDATNLEWNNESENLAYVIYTSGSTGKPKGNLTTHRNIVRVVKETNYIEINNQDSVLQLSSYAFDGSTFDIYGALLNGAKLVLIPKEVLLDISNLANLIEQQQISVMFITTALFNVLVDVKVDCLEHVRSVLFGGERVSVNHVRKALQHLGPGKIKHVYGPTESTVFATCHAVDVVEDTSITVPIGKPISNTEIYILDEANQLQPLGVVGELCISGDGLARGYLNRDDLTAEKFVDNPFVEGKRMYRTGDLAKWLPGGEIEYVGRMDHQVKIRGFRIELGEIEAAMLQIDSIQEAIVITIDGDSDQKQLCAYYVADQNLNSKTLKETLSHKLPRYMIPAYFVQMEQMPLTPNGKVDRKQLPAPDGGIHTRAEFVAPRTAEEEKLAQIWKEVLEVQTVGVKDNFFDLGGHSLKLMQLVHKIRSETEVEMPLNKLFEKPSLEEMAKELAERILRLKYVKKFEEEEATQITKLNENGKFNVFCFPPGGGYGLSYLDMAQLLENQYVVYGLDFIENLDYEQMLEQYVDLILTVQDQSPFVFLGYSIGGNLAFEVAKVMEKKGYEVSDIIMVDIDRRNTFLEFTPEQLDELVESLVEGVEEHYANPMRRQINAYLNYVSQLINSGEVQADIHGLVARHIQIENTKESNELLWREATLKGYTEYMVMGDHEEVFEPQYITENLNILREILNKIHEKNTSLVKSV
ncbi:non-ribosomal peptide synthetase [Caldalkalibacillus mannanilyticus]|uniref:non-ribosomal peptide synthetase n=1 Tax=Caldalkalibacillus mannanilyticus TaxID=1418 RepID=UPI0034E30368